MCRAAHYVHVPEWAAQHSPTVAPVLTISAPPEPLWISGAAPAPSADTEQRGGKFAPATSAITRSAPPAGEPDA